MKRFSFIRIVLGLILGLNLVTLITVFLIPRLTYDAGGSVDRERAMRLAEGPFDLPNIFIDSYRMAYALLDRTEPDSVILFVGDDQNQWSHSALWQVLYPRRLMFEGKDFLVGEHGTRPVYRVLSRYYTENGCRENSAQPLEKTSFVICSEE